MGVGAVVGVVGVGISIGAKLLSKKSSSSTKTETPQPDSLANLQVATTTEGTPVPIAYGSCRLAPTYIWYGGYFIMPYMGSTASGGKGSSGGSSSYVAGYYYFVSLWLAVALCGNSWSESLADDGETYTAVPSPVAITNMWKDGSNVGVNTMFYYIDSSTGMLTNVFGAVATFINTGVGNTAPQSMGISGIQYPLLLEGIATVNCVNYISKDGWRTPSYEFSVMCIPFAPWTADYTDASKGANPANVVYDLLKRAGVADGQIDVPSFEAMARQFANPEGVENNGWPTPMINMSITSQESCGDLIAKALENLYAFLAIKDGKFQLKNSMVEFASVAGTIKDDFSAFSMKPRDVWDMPSEVRAKYLDNVEYSEQIVSFYNENVRRLKGGAPCPVTIDLTRFTDYVTAMFYAYYIGASLADMSWTLNCTCSLRAAHILPGEVWVFENSVNGVKGAFMVKSVSINPFDEGTVEIEADSTTIFFEDLENLSLTSEEPTGRW